MGPESYEIKEIYWNGQKLTVCVYEEDYIPETTGPPLHVRYQEQREHKKQHGKASIFIGDREL